MSIVKKFIVQDQLPLSSGSDTFSVVTSEDSVIFEFITNERPEIISIDLKEAKKLFSELIEEVDMRISAEERRNKNIIAIKAKRNVIGKLNDMIDGKQ